MIRFLIYISLTLLAFSLKAQELVHLQEGEEHPVPLMGYNAHMAHAPSWDDENFTDALKKLHPQILRYPGGSNSFYWDWKTGWTKSYTELLPHLQQANFQFEGEKIISSERLRSLAKANKNKDSFWTQILRYNKKSIRPNKIEHFKNGLLQNKSEGVFCLNVVSSTIQYELQLLKKAQELEMTINFIELGNEINHPNLILEHFYPNAQAYADTCVKWAKEIWAVFPDAQIGVVGGNKNNRTKEWNETLISSFENGVPEKIEQLNFILHYYSHLKKPLYQFNNEDEYRQLMSYPKIDIRNKLKKWHWSRTNSFESWITEYNISEKKPHDLNNKWIHGLFVSNQIHQLLSQTNARLFNFHSIGSDAFPGFAVLDLMSKDERYLQPTASGIVTSLWNRLTADAESFQNIELDNELWEIYYASKLTCHCPNNPRLPTTIEFNPIHAYRSSKEGKQKLLLTNTSEKSIQINLSEIGISNGFMEQYSGSLTHDVRGELNQGDDWKVTKKEVHNKIEIPPYSITLIEE